MIKPIKDYVLILLEKEESKTKSGIILPGKENRHETDRGLVVRWGPFVQDEVCDKYVIFKKWEGEEMEEDDKKYILITEDNIIATYSNNEVCHSKKDTQ